MSRLCCDCVETKKIAVSRSREETTQRPFSAQGEYRYQTRYEWASLKRKNGARHRRADFYFTITGELLPLFQISIEVSSGISGVGI